jgi:hypothetical protein
MGCPTRPAHFAGRVGKPHPTRLPLSRLADPRQEGAQHLVHILRKIHATSRIERSSKPLASYLRFDHLCQVNCAAPIGALFKIP